MAHPDLNRLLDGLLRSAQELLAKQDEFYPFASSINANGQLSSEAAHAGNEQPSPRELIDMIGDVFRQRAAAGQLRAAGICYDARVLPSGQSKKTDAICVALEHQTGEAVNVYLPYEKGKLGKIEYGDLLATSRVRQFF